MARYGPKPKLLSLYFSASKSCAQLADNWDGSEGLSVYSLWKRHAKSRMCCNSAQQRACLSRESKMLCIGHCRTGCSASTPGSTCKDQVVYVPSKWRVGLKLLHSKHSLLPWTLRFENFFLWAGPGYMSWSLTHTQIDFVRFRPNLFQFNTLNWSVCSVSKQACLSVGLDRPSFVDRFGHDLAQQHPDIRQVPKHRMPLIGTNYCWSSLCYWSSFQLALPEQSQKNDSHL